MKEKDKKKIDTEKIKKAFTEAIEKKLEEDKKYRETPSKEHLDKILADMTIGDNDSILLIKYNSENKEMVFKGVKVTTPDIYTMAHFVLAKISALDPARILDCISTLARQKELNDCWCEHNEKPEEIKDDDDNK